MDEHQQVVFVANGDVQAHQIQAFLEAAGIPCELRGESLTKTHGLTLGELGMVEIVVADVDEERARALLASADRGELRVEDDIESSS